ncbi:O-methyltransferase [Fluviispira multicolorata]|uniref:Methyltransferase domain-containing protein n=1 Tax=Fluviispira multicolorata TaxID=2654512 RepID=A0A833JB00_9BACT|nr:class I SAM-dependent methyltransferase [Fluviispira multicolorata]KAB8028530.1 methyltransferase domain-containing protein [Fluviispira multicolorata]
MNINLEKFNESNAQEIISFIRRKSKEIGFEKSSQQQTGALLRLLASSKPRGKFLELGTGTGFGSAWLLEGMDDHSKLISVDCDDKVLSVAKEAFIGDKRIELVHENGFVFLKKQEPKSFDLIFADAFPGKYDLIHESLNLLKPGGFYIIDDMLPQPFWSEEHSKNLEDVYESLKNLSDVHSVGMNWSSGLVIFVPK